MSAPPEIVDAARRMIAARRRRRMHLPAGVLGEPAWDVLLDLLVCQAEGRPVPLNSACAASGVPTTTAMRCIDSLARHGLIVRSPDSDDRRRTLIELTARGHERICAAVVAADGALGWRYPPDASTEPVPPC